MKIDNDRTDLDAALKDPRITFLFAFGEPNTVAEQIHNKAGEIGLEDDRKIFWITKPEILNKSDRAAWYKSDDQYTMLSAEDDGTSRRIVCQKPLTELCLVSGGPSVRKIRAAFAEAEE